MTTNNFYRISKPWSSGVGVCLMLIVDAVTMMIVSRQMRERPPPTSIFFFRGHSLASIKQLKEVKEKIPILEFKLNTQRVSKKMSTMLVCGISALLARQFQF